MAATRIVQIGLGPLGRMLTHRLLERGRHFRIVGAVDTDPALTGKDLGEVSGLARKTGIRVVPSLDRLPAGARPRVALLTTVSDMRRIAPQIAAIVARGIHVVSTCEELSHPWKTSPRLARRIDAAARRHGAAVLGTGVNPGFLMDHLPTTLTAVCRRVDRIRVSRIQDARFRRVPFQKKIGAGLTPAQFKARQKAGTLRHVGLTESMHMIAERMGWPLSRTEEVLTPVIATRRIRTKAMTIERGMARGVQQIGRGFVKGEEKITLFFRAAVGEPKPEDRVEIFGEPNIVSRIPGGVNGDVATCAITLNAVAQVLRARPGLHTMTELPVPSYRA
jgi:4-hydroxy-tetrahydrodipicolinate reductase